MDTTIIESNTVDESHCRLDRDQDVANTGSTMKRTSLFADSTDNDTSTTWNETNDSFNTFCTDPMFHDNTYIPTLYFDHQGNSFTAMRSRSCSLSFPVKAKKKHVRSKTFCYSNNVYRHDNSTSTQPTTPSTCASMSQATLYSSSTNQSLSKSDYHGPLSPFTPPSLTLGNSSSSSSHLLSSGSYDDYLQPINESFMQNLRNSFRSLPSYDSASCKDNYQGENDTTCSDDSFVLTNAYEQDDLLNERHEPSCTSCSNGNDTFLNLLSKLGFKVGNKIFGQAPQSVIDLNFDGPKYEDRIIIEGINNDDLYDEEIAKWNENETPKMSSSRNKITNNIKQKDQDTNDQSTLASHNIEGPPFLPDLSHPIDSFLTLEKPITARISPRASLYHVFDSPRNSTTSPPHPLLTNSGNTTVITPTHTNSKATSTHSSKTTDYATNSLPAPLHPLIHQIESEKKHLKVDSSTTSSSSSPQHHLIKSTMATIDIDIEAEWHNEASKCEEMGDYTRALQCYSLCLNKYSITKEALPSSQSKSLENNRKLISLQKKIGTIHWKMGSYDLSHRALEEALSETRILMTQKNGYSEKSDDSVTLKENLAAILNSIGRVHASQGSYDRAMKNHVEALSVLKSTMDQNPEYLEKIDINDEVSLIGESDLMRELNSYSHHERDLSGSSLNFDQAKSHILHPDIARTLIYIGTIHQLEGNFSIAMARFRDGLFIQKKTVGPNHVDIGETLNAIGSVYEKEGDHIKAMRCYKKAHRIYVEKLGRVHVDVAVALNNIGQVYHSLEKYKKSMVAYDESLAIMRQVLGEGHRNIATTLFNKGLVYVSCEEYNKAEAIFKEVLSSQRSALGDIHVDVALTLQSLGDLYEKVGKFEKAINYLYKTLKIRRKTLGKNHIHVAFALDRLGQLHLKFKNGDLNEAAYRLKDALRLYHLNQIGKDDPLVVTASNNLDLAMQLKEKQPSPR